MEGLKNHQSKCFTIIEAVIAVSILMIGFFGVSQLFPFGLSLQKSSEMKTQATQFAQSKIEKIVSESYLEIRCTLSAVPCEEIEDQIPENTSFSRNTVIKFADPFNDLQEPVPSDTDTGIKKIEVTVSWNAPLLITGQEVKLVVIIASK